MAESAVHSTSLTAVSNTLFDIVCQPCSSEGTNAEAEGYCQDCCEHLCAQCISCHKKFSMSKHHTLVNKENMPTKHDTAPVKDVCTEICQIHKDEIIKYFCPAHKVLGCTVCITLKHKLCEDVAYIPDVATGLENSKDYMEFKAELEYLIQKSKETAKISQNSKQKSSACLVRAIQDIEAYRQEIVDTLDTKVNALKIRARQINAHDTENINTLADDINKVLTELQSLFSEFETLLNTKQYCQMFIKMKRKEENFTGLKAKLEDMNGSEVSDYKYEHDDEFRTIIGRKSGFGKLVMTKAVKGGSTVKGVP